MAEPLRFKTSDGKEYVLEFNRKTVQMAEKGGLSIDDLDKKIMSAVPELFYYSFKMHQFWIKREETDRILFDEFKGLTEDELKQLVELYTAPYDTLLNNAVGEEKNSRTVTIIK